MPAYFPLKLCHPTPVSIIINILSTSMKTENVWFALIVVFQLNIFSVPSQTMETVNSGVYRYCYKWCSRKADTNGQMIQCVQCMRLVHYKCIYSNDYHNYICIYCNYYPWWHLNHFLTSLFSFCVNISVKKYYFNVFLINF